MDLNALTGGVRQPAELLGRDCSTYGKQLNECVVYCLVVNPNENTVVFFWYFLWRIFTKHIAGGSTKKKGKQVTKYRHISDRESNPA